MRPLRAALALAYMLSFVAACLGACLSAEAAHGCCAGEQGLRSAPAAERDCCQVVPGVSGKIAAAGGSAPQTLGVTHEVLPPSAVAHVAAPAPAAAGPPLILRI